MQQLSFSLMPSLWGMIFVRIVVNTTTLVLQAKMRDLSPSALGFCATDAINAGSLPHLRDPISLQPILLENMSMHCFPHAIVVMDE